MSFLHQFSPQPILFQFGPLTIHWYGFFIALSFLLGIVIILYLAKKKNIKSDEIFDLGFWLVLAGIIGARLYEVIFINWHYYQNNLSAIFKIWQGGLAIHGAILGGLFVLLIWTRIKKTSFWLWSDLAVVVLALGQAIGRWGNYFNQELFGRPTNASWGIFIEVVNRPAEFIQSSYFHPAFLYESILNFILFLILFFIVKKSSRLSISTLIYLIGYSIIRFFMEFIRIDPTPEFWGLRLPQWVSLLIFALVILILFKKLRNIRIH